MCVAMLRHFDEDGFHLSSILFVLNVKVHVENIFCFNKERDVFNSFKLTFSFFSNKGPYFI